MSAPIRTPTSQVLENSDSLMSLMWSCFPLPCLHWSMGNLLIGNTIPEAVQEFVIGFALECCFDEIKKLTIFDS